MDRDPRLYLTDVVDAADAVASYTDGMDLTAYEADRLVRDAVERRLEIVGEALSRLSRYAPELAARVPDLSRAIGLRNIIAHGYDQVDDATLWAAATRSLPAMRSVVVAILAELEAAELNSAEE